jgi:hypothetical protein
VLGDTRFTTEFVTEYGNRPTIAAYLFLFSAYCAAGIAGFLLLIRRYSLAAPDRSLRVGLTTMMLGAVTGLLWATWKIVVLVVNWVSPQPVGVEAVVTALLSSTTAALVTIGAAIPLAVRYVRGPLRRHRSTRHARQMDPLWRELHEAVPEIKLGVADAHNDEFSVYRRVIEIRDANLALRVYCHPDVADWAIEAARARGLADDEVDVIAEAAMAAAMIEAHAAGVRYHTDAATAETPQAGTGNIDAERDWLIRVARAFAHDPTVRQIRERVRHEVGAARSGKR